MPIDTAASMHLAAFYNRGEAVHSGNLDEASQGCIHFDSWESLTRLNYHSVRGRTKVSVSYGGTSKALFKP